MATHSSILAWRIPWTEANLVGYSPWGRKTSDMTEETELARDEGSILLHALNELSGIS